VFDALTHARTYKKAWPMDEALAEIRLQSGSQFDPAVVKAFLDLHSSALLLLPATKPLEASSLQVLTPITTILAS
jgi:HD-GYP domain-containing protein (c-di-GMP phosphodiesterase class II)